MRLHNYFDHPLIYQLSGPKKKRQFWILLFKNSSPVSNLMSLNDLFHLATVHDQRLWAVLCVQIRQKQNCNVEKTNKQVISILTLFSLIVDENSE